MCVFSRCDLILVSHKVVWMTSALEMKLPPSIGQIDELSNQYLHEPKTL